MQFNNFTKAEIAEVCTDIEQTSADLFVRLDNVRDDIGVPIYLIDVDKLEHESIWHERRKAVDWYVLEEDMNRVHGEYDPDILFYAALKQFAGIGLYWNGVLWSVHTDIRPVPDYWKARRVDGEWKYEYLI